MKFKSKDFENVTTARRAYKAQGIKLTKSVQEEILAKVKKHNSRTWKEPQIESGRYLSNGSAYSSWQQEREDFAVKIGRAVHNRIATLHRSAYAYIDYGEGGRLVHDWGIYAKSYRHPAKYRNSGARIEGQEIIVENSSGKEVLRIPLPSLMERRKIVCNFKSNQILLNGDLWGKVKREGLVERFALRKGEVKKIGYALLCERISSPREGKKEERIKYLEHGKKIK
jgi:hypothetical protein